MADRPILFSGPMIRALLDGKKTQTRRVLKLNGRLPEFCGPAGCQDDPECWGWEDYDHGDWITLEKEPGQRMGWRDWRGAYAPGDRLWVREAWRPGIVSAAVYCVSADEEDDGPWKPSIHMPRWASRLTLLVTGVRVQRLHDISEGDAIAEGAQEIAPGCFGVPGTTAMSGTTAVECFARLWSVINGPGAWDANPWVVALTFTVHRCNIDQMEARA